MSMSGMSAMTGNSAMSGSSEVTGPSPFAEYLFATDGSDTSGNNRNGSITGTVSGGVLQCAMNGMTIANADAPSFASPYTVTFAFRSMVGPGSGLHSILSKDQGTAWNEEPDFHFAVLWLVVTGGFVTVAIEADLGFYGVTDIATDMAWHHVAVSVGDGVIKIYVDGVEDLSDVAGFGSGSSQDVFIGNHATTSEGESCELDNLKFYSEVLSAAAIAAIAAADTP